LHASYMMLTLQVTDHNHGHVGQEQGQAMLRSTARTGIVLGALGLVLVAGLLTAVGRRPLAEPVYTVAAVRAGLRQHPQAWIGRTVLVQGRLAGALDWGTAHGSSPLNPLYPLRGLMVRIRLVPPDLKGFPPRDWRGPDLWVAPHLALPPWGSLVAVLRHVPVVGQLFPAPKPWDALLDRPGVFRLTLLPSHATVCQNVCSDALLDEVQT
jgi:hypothetical protein